MITLLFHIQLLQTGSLSQRWTKQQQLHTTRWPKHWKLYDRSPNFTNIKCSRSVDVNSIFANTCNLFFLSILSPPNMNRRAFKHFVFWRGEFFSVNCTLRLHLLIFFVKGFVSRPRTPAASLLHPLRQVRILNWKVRPELCATKISTTM